MKVKIQEERKKSLFPLETKRNILVIDILNEISKLISKETDVEFTRLLVGQTNVLISGNTDTFNSVDDMKNLLEQAGLFQKVTISSANINKSGNRVRFKLKVQL
jgi:Tfp pilus assembly protein PilN